VLVGAEWGQGFEPLGRRAMMIEVPLLHLRRFPDARLGCCVTNDHEMPGLEVCPAGRGATGEQAGLDQLAGNGPVAELAHGASASELGAEFIRTTLHFVGWVFAVRGEGQESRHDGLWAMGYGARNNEGERYVLSPSSWPIAHGR
jgi:hypothetical protein